MSNVAELLDAYQVDVSHARQVADLALTLYDAVADRYGLSASQRRLLEIGALLHNVGLTTDPPEHHLVGRDIVLRHAIEELSQRERALVACMVAFHRKKVRPQLEPAYLALGKKGQREALQLSAILRVADGLDYSQSQTTRILEVAPGDDDLTLTLSGPHAAEDGARAVAKADLWRRIFGDTVRVVVDGAEVAPSDDGRVSEPAASDEEEETATLSPWYASPDAPLAELGRVMLRRHLRRLRLAERGVRSEDPVEPVHDLRVATRRLRATLRILAPVYAPHGLRPYTRGLGSLARVAGPVRDRDVLLADMRQSVSVLPEDRQAAFVALIEAVQDERRAALKRLLAFLEHDDFAVFLRDFAEMMSASSGWDERVRVRDLAGSMIWRHYETLRSHDDGGLPADAEELHAMRIDGKRLRYVLEFFAETLGPAADTVIRPLMDFQDHLGALNDISVTRQLLAPYADDPQLGAAVAAYLDHREQKADQLRAELPACWERLNNLSYRRNLMELLIQL